MPNFKRLSPEATVIPIRKTPICKWGICKWGTIKHPVFNALKFRGWIQRNFNLLSRLINVILSKMSSIQPLQFRMLKTGRFKMPCLKTLRLKMRVFQTVITVTSGHSCFFGWCFGGSSNIYWPLF